MHIAICDDDPQDRAQIVHVLNEIFQNEKTVKIFSDGTELADYYRERSLPFDLILLDIYMKRMDGVTTAKKIRERDPFAIIIFLTISRDLWAEGYGVQAYQYLVKPIDNQRLTSVIKDAIAKHKKRNAYLTIAQNKELIRIAITDILYLEVSERRICLHLWDENIVFGNGTLKEYYSKLPNTEFFQIHQSIVVNLGFVQSIDAEQRELHLMGGRVLLIARERLSDTMDAVVTYGRKTIL